MSVFDEQERLEALAKWARRVIEQAAPSPIERRRGGRAPWSRSLALVPLDRASLRPEVARRTLVATKDRSSDGFAVVSNIPLDAELYLAESDDGIFLARKVRDRKVQGSVVEYGFQVLDRYRSFEELARL